MSVLKDEWAVERYGRGGGGWRGLCDDDRRCRQFGRLECSFEHGNSFQEGPGFIGSRIRETDLRSVRSMEPDRLC